MTLGNSPFFGALALIADLFWLARYVLQDNFLGIAHVVVDVSNTLHPSTVGNSKAAKEIIPRSRDHPQESSPSKRKSLLFSHPSHPSLTSSSYLHSTVPIAPSLALNTLPPGQSNQSNPDWHIPYANAGEERSVTNLDGRLLEFDRFRLQYCWATRGSDAGPGPFTR